MPDTATSSPPSTSAAAAPAVSVVIPTYNERENIGWMIEQTLAAFAGRDVEVLVVDDDSPDGTGDIVCDWSARHPGVRLITKTAKEGIGAALRVGYDQARGEVIVSCDADRSYDIADLVRLVAAVQAGDDLALGCRHTAQACYEAEAWRIRCKRWVSAMGNRVLRRVFGLPIHDFSANCRAIRRSTWQAIHTRENTNTLLLEMILRCYDGGFRVSELPIRFKDRVYGASKLRLSIEAPKFLVKMLRFRLRDWRGQRGGRA